MSTILQCGSTSEQRTDQRDETKESGTENSSVPTPFNPTRKMTSMKHSTIPSVICATLLTVACGGSLLTFAQQPVAKEAAQQLPLTARQPGGFIKEQLGIYLTIEGVLYDGNGKVESNSLVVDTVDGNKLDKPIVILVRNVRLPAKTRCILKGYELGA